MGNLNLPSLISQESAGHDVGEAIGRTRSVLALGEINNMRDARSSRTAAWPVVAMAAGEGGHEFQISSIRTVKWNWAGFSFPAGGLESRFYGSWRSDGSPITQIKFAAKAKQFDSMRWFIVQKETSTTIFEPELRAKPITRQASIMGRQTTSVEHIVVRPIVTLTSALTGDEAHCDFSINMGPEEEAPQLAIVDSSGMWSVWILDREGQGKHSKVRAVLKSKGSWDPPLSTRPWGINDLSSKAYSIAWINIQSNRDDWVREESPPSEPGHVSVSSLRNAFLSGLKTPLDRSNGLAICNNTHLQALSAADDKFVTWLDFTRRDRADALLSIQTFPGSPSHLIALTTDAVHLLDAGVNDEGKTKPIVILFSCRHYRNARREGLKLSVTRLELSNEGEMVSLVMLFSTHNHRVDLFSFTISQENGTAHFHHQVLHLPHSDQETRGNNRGIESLRTIPLQLRPDSKNDAVHDAEPSPVQFFQIFGLTTGLSLVSTIVSYSKEALETLPVQTELHDSGWSENRRSKFLRNKLLRQNERAFVIADQDDEDHRQLSATQSSQSAGKAETVHLRYYLGRLVEEINRGFFGEADRDDAAGNLHGPLSPIIQTAQDLEEGSLVPLRPISGFSKWWQPISLSREEEQWELELKQLGRYQDVQLFELGGSISRLGLMDLFEKFSTNWSARLPADGLKAMQWRYMELALERMAVEVYLSARGVYMVPQETRDVAAKAAPAEKGDVEDDYGVEELFSSQPGSQRNFSTPRTTPSHSRATSEAFDDGSRSQTEEDPGHEDPAVARLRMYLPSIRFTPPQRSGPSRVVSLWPVQRGVDPTEYKYRPPGTGADAQSQAAKRRREKEEEKRRRKAERRAQLGIKMEGIAESWSQQVPPSSMRSSPLPPDVKSDQIHSQGSGPGPESQSTSQGQSQSQSFGFGGFSQTMSQPLPGEFGNRQARLKKKTQVKKAMKGFR